MLVNGKADIFLLPGTKSKYLEKHVSGSIPNCSMASSYLIISSTDKKYHRAAVDRRMGEMW